MGAEETRGSYLFADLAAKDTDAWIELARRGGFANIHLHGWWSTLGHYEPRGAYFPNGLRDMKRVAARIRAAGLKPGDLKNAVRVRRADDHARLVELQRHIAVTGHDPNLASETEIASELLGKGIFRFVRRRRQGPADEPLKTTKTIASRVFPSSSTNARDISRSKARLADCSWK